MATEKLRTIGAVFDYNFKYRDTWQTSHKQSDTNMGHAQTFYEIHGRGYKVKDITQETMDIVKNWMYEQRDSSNRTVNYCTSNVANALNFCLSRGRIAVPSEPVVFFNTNTNKFTFEKLPEKKVTKPIFTRDKVIHMY